MKLIIEYTTNGRVRSVTTFDYYLKRNKTDKDICDAITTANGNFHQFDTVDITDEALINALDYLIGNNGYRILHNCEDVYQELKSLHDDLRDIDDRMHTFDDGLDHVLDSMKHLETNE